MLEKYKPVKNYAPRKWKERMLVIKFNYAFLAVLSVEGLRGGYTSWGLTESEAINNVKTLAGYD